MFHVFLPQMRMSTEAIVERALAAETAGFEGIAFMDHMAPPLATEHDMWEAMTIAGWVLARTTTLVVSHLVLCDSLRHPAMLARQVTTLDADTGLPHRRRVRAVGSDRDGGATIPPYADGHESGHRHCC